MRRIIAWAGVLACLLLGWLAGRLTVPEHPLTGVKYSSVMPREAKRNVSVPRDMGRLDAKAWLVSLDEAELRERILQVVREPETRHREDRLLALFGRLFEINGNAAADLWLSVEADCQLDLRCEMSRWATRSPQEAAAWFIKSADELRRYRAGFLVVDVAKLIIQAITDKDAELGVRLLMEDAAFYDSGCLFAVGLELSVSDNSELLETVVTWAARQGDDPTNSLRTLSGNRIDATGWGIKFLSRADKHAALKLYGQLPPADPRRESWIEGIVSGWGDGDRTAAMYWWVSARRQDKDWGEGEIMVLMDWARDQPDEWLPWMREYLPENVADRAMAMAIDRTSPPSLMHLRLCSAIRSEETRAKMAALIRSKGDLEELRQEANGQADLEALLIEGR